MLFAEICKFSCGYCSGVSAFNQFIHECLVNSDMGSSVDYSYEEDYADDYDPPSTPLSQSSQVSSTSRFSKHNMHGGNWAHCFRYIVAWMLFPAKFLAGILIHF